MAVNLRDSVRSVIKELKKNIDQKASELASLKDELKRHARAHELLGGDRARTRRPRARGKSNVTVDWNSVLKELPATKERDGEDTGRFKEGRTRLKRRLIES